ncbi:DUF1934 domain-containing protein [Clostridium fallax]|uniref:Uncharacterized beta-barrel protein YwiB, DUF1934 family n=1 Tax=Clostridium fallax TaxID=1533 RepID=A0A1M4WIJ2_9CLOT|nr:DUF1934 domain-containing protein [Clostridium fallax]SHE80970.1 Uncharacterized beta-barrel protein YwiB, DUF1934 family [Clostridium fallax]SQB05723.1 calycin-like domain-containing protein [Clostridium fallax]
MKKKALISISSCQNDDSQDSIEVVTPGEFHITEEGFEACYDETEISGMEGTKTKLLICKDFVKLQREGTTSTEMSFERDSSSVSLYNTPYGMLELKINTKDLQVNVDKEGGDVAIRYNLSVAGQEPQYTELKINIKAQNIDN